MRAWEIVLRRHAPEIAVSSDQSTGSAPGSVATSDPISGWYEVRRSEFESGLAAHLKVLKSAATTHTRLAEAVEYSMTAGGKRLRPVLVLECCSVCGGTDDAAMPAAIAMECVHAFSLIHDDLPAMDDDDLRRGRPTNHRVFGEALAILAGDWLLAHALSLPADQARSPAIAAASTRELAAATADMITGQAVDIESEGRPADQSLVRLIHGWKTARLMEASCRLGAIAAEADDASLAALGAFGRHLGVAFQIVDDLLDATGAEDAVGKRVGKDAAVEKQTYPAAFGVEASRVAARRECELALESLVRFGSRAERLRDIARFVVARDR